MKSGTHFILVVVLTLVALQPNLLKAQSLGVEIGTAAVENYDPGELNLGFSFVIPFSELVFCDISYNHWQGQDGNYTYQINLPNLGSDGSYWGNSGVNMTIFYKIVNSNTFSASIGAGLGRYKMIHMTHLSTLKNEYEYNRSTCSIAALLQYTVSDIFSIYGKALINTVGIDSAPDWGLFNIGISFSPF